MIRPIVVFLKALEAGERWITVRPNGPGTEGQPVLIQPQPDGSAKVVGGAGGALNHLRLTGVKPQSAYKDTIAERAANRRAQKKDQAERDKKLGLQTAKAEAHKKVQGQRQRAQGEFVAAVGKELGWDPKDYQFDESALADVPADAADRMRRAHGQEMVKRAMVAVRLNREQIISDADARAKADIGEIPLMSEDPDELSVQDIDPVRPEGAGLGFATDYKARAERSGLTEQELSAESELGKCSLTNEQRKAAIARGDTAKLVQENLKALRDGDSVRRLSPKVVEAKRALELMRLEKKLKLAERQAAKAHKEISATESEPKAYVLEVDDAEVDKRVADDVANDLRTIRTRAFLAEVAKDSENPMRDLARHVGAGAYNSVNALALAAGGSALVDRSVVDVLGIAGAAEVLARRLKTDLSPDECAQIADGMEEFHIHRYMESSEDAIRQARELRAQAAEIELGAAENGSDLAALQEINKRRGEAIAESQKVLGQALGEMEANAALVLALKGGKSEKPLEVSLGKAPVESAIRQCRAIGLQRGDYSIDNVAGNRVLTVLPQGMDRLAAPVNRADLEQVRRNLDIISGRYDEEGWMPKGVADRPDLDLHPKPGVAQQLAEPFNAGADMAQSVRDYAGGRAADGDAAADIVADMQAADFIQKIGSGRADEYRAALDQVLPLWDEHGKMRPAESLNPALEKMADDFVSSRYGASRSPIHRQKFVVGPAALDGLHRALSMEPTGVAAFKPIGELTPQDQSSLREFFAQHIAKESADARDMRRELEHAAANEPARQTTDMFGDTVTNPEWSEWRRKRDDLSEKVSAASMTWQKYVASMHGTEKAYSAVQDLVRSKVSKDFVDTYNTLDTKSPLKLGRTVIRQNLDHLDAVDPKAREAREAKERELVDRLRNRKQGRYAEGSVRGKLDEAREQQAGFEAAQMGFFAEEPTKADRPLDPDERYTAGHEAERQIAELMPIVGRNFHPGHPVKLIRPEMSGGKNAPRQRAIKMIEANKRVVLSFGTGSGKTLVGLAGYTNLQQQGKAKRGLFLVPSIVQEQYNGDALRFLKPGEFKWQAKPGASRNERIAAYKDPETHFAVITHQAFRDDMIHLGAGHANIPESEMAARVGAMSRADRKEWMRGVMRREGIAFDYLNVDEGHDTLNRAGKDNSDLANVIDAASDNSNYYVNASADPIKNDVSEAFSLLQKMDPARYNDQAAFMRRYGVDTLSAQDDLRRELARFQYPSKIDPDITATRSERRVELSDEQRHAASEIDKLSARVRMARIRGAIDVEAVKALSPQSFEGVPAEKVDEVAAALQRSLGVIKESAMRRIINGGSKVDEISKIASERQGKPGVVFAHSLEAVKQIGERLTREGHRVVTITGGDTGKSKADKAQMFNPDTGDAGADILVASDAAATGLNAQRGRWVANMDTPDTAKTHAQRNGRINRIGQTHDVELIDLVANHPDETRARKRLATKYALRDALTTPMEGLDDTGLALFLRKRQIAAENGGFL